MDYRSNSFFRRFKNAKAHLKAQALNELISFKYRERCVSYSEYSHFVDDYLKRQAGLNIEPLGMDFGEQAWLVKDAKGNSAIIIQHETGLEILGAVGSIASLIALIPLIVSGWARVRDRFFRPRFDGREINGVEIRRFDKKNNLVEQQAPSIEIYVLNLILQDRTLLMKKIDRLEKQIELLKNGKRIPHRGNKHNVKKKKQ